MIPVPQKIKICIEAGCKNIQSTKDFCRLHYLKYRKEQLAFKKRRRARKLDSYVEGIIKQSEGSKFPKEDLAESTSPTDEVEGLIEDLGYADPDSLEMIISHMRINKDYE
jgi:hypothetical protein